MSLTVSELLALEGLSALRLRAGKQGLQRAVRWYYVAENEHIAEWIMGGELVFITGINHPRDEANLIQLLMEGKQRGIAGMVILTGEAYIHAIPATLIALADELGMPLIEQPYLLKMVIVTERIGTALVRSENVLQSQRDILMQLVTGDYPDLQMLHQRALHQQLDFTRPLRLAALRLEGLSRLFPLCAGIFAGLCGVLVHCGFENIFEEPYMMAYFWSLAGLLMWAGFLRESTQEVRA